MIDCKRFNVSDKEEFEKLFKLNFPVKENFDYYINMLIKSPFYAGLGNVVDRFNTYESEVKALGYKGARSYKLDYALPKIVEYITHTGAYKRLMDGENFIFNSKLRTKDELKINDDTFLVSIDFKSANYNALKTFDVLGELSSSWEELCNELDIHPVLASSKSFRQYVFGNTNPKRLQKVQHSNILKIVDKLIEDHGFIDDDFVFISHDEFIVRLQSDKTLAINKIHLLTSAVGNIIEHENINMPTHYRVFKNKSISGNMCVQTYYGIGSGAFSPKYDVLFKVPGNKFFKYFKTHILREPLESLDKRDLMFMNDGEIAVWSVEDDSISEVMIPPGEMNLEQIMMSHGQLYDRIRKNVPGLSDSQRRKLINIFANTCKGCMNEEADSCHCWKY